VRCFGEGEEVVDDFLLLLLLGLARCELGVLAAGIEGRGGDGMWMWRKGGWDDPDSETVFEMCVRACRRWSNPPPRKGS